MKQQTLSILLVSKDHRATFAQEKLTQLGTVVVISSFKKALLLASSGYHLVVLDMNMSEPDMTSLIFLKQLKEEKPDLECICFSASEDSKLCIEAMASGAYFYLIFPFQKSDIEPLIQSILSAQIELQRFIESKAHRHLEADIEDRKWLLNELIHTRRITGTYVELHEFNAFFPPHDYKNPEIRLLAQHYLGDKGFISLQQESEPPMILIVEDEKNVRETVADILLNSGYEVIQAATGKEAIYQAENAKKIDLFLLDIGLPDKSGLELIPLLQNSHPKAETMMLTAYANHTGYVIDAFKKHAYDYIPKPFNNTYLLLKVSKAIQKSYFRQILPEIQDGFIDKKLTAMCKFKILTDIANKRHLSHKRLQMKDVYLFFPELIESKIPPFRTLPEKIIQDGILLFADFLKTAIREQRDCSNFIENWENNF